MRTIFFISEDSIKLKEEGNWADIPEVYRQEIDSMGEFDDANEFSYSSVIIHPPHELGDRFDNVIDLYLELRDSLTLEERRVIDDQLGLYYWIQIKNMIDDHSLSFRAIEKETGVSKSTIHKYYNKEYNIGYRDFVSLMNYFDLSL